MKHFSLFSSFLLAIALAATSHTDAFTRNDFPKEFLFGAATSAYQWEGAVDEDGRTPSVWDTTAHCNNGSVGGDIACDGYHKYKEDVKLMAEMGLEAFRFSISWSRLLPNGRGAINPKGLLFYKNLIKELRSHGIEPHVTLYHYDLPQSLEDEYGGWTNRKIIEDFTAFADICFREFGEDVKLWTTINDATIFAIGSYGQGVNFGHCTTTNGSTGNLYTETYIAGHNMLLAHASVSNLYKLKYKSKQRGSIGLSIFAFGLSPYTNSKDDEIATERAKAFLFGWMLKPLVFGDYPDEMKITLGSRLPVFSAEESEQVKGSSDYIGIIHYMTLYVTNQPSPPIFPLNTNKVFSADVGAYMIPIGNSSSFTFKSTPWGLEGVLEYLKQSYNNPPIYILENGKLMKHDSMLQDTSRLEYIQAYIGAVLNAIKSGSDTRGYFVWSMVDVYEIISEYELSYGMYYVNFSDPGLKRTPKLSASWYTGFLNGAIDVASQDIITQLQQNNFSGSSSV
ncbi:beta-glucosidase 8 isoform X1 [Capsella rubella]|nr:beta-glucosidase 8 isoform X1 [Capsella rubella]